MTSIIQHSSGESNALGLKLGRTDISKLTVDAFVQALVEGRFDCCIVKAKSHLPDLMLRLDALNMPYAISGITQRYDDPYHHLPDQKYDNDNWTFELYDGSQTELLQKLVPILFGKEPLMFYQLPYYRQLVEQEQEVNCLFEYLKSFDNVLENGMQKRLLFLKDAEGYFGLTAMTFFHEKSRAESEITGILPKKRGQGLYKDIVRFIRNHFKAHIEVGACGARIQNIPAQRTYLSEGMKIAYYIFTLHCFPFLSKKSETAKHIQLSLDNQEISTFSSILFSQLQTVIQQSMLSETVYTLKKYQYLKLQTIDQETSTELAAKLYFPIHNTEQILAVAQIEHQTKGLVGVAYFDYDAF